MEYVVLATAGHIDHGKTELTLALTGINTDRLPEEKARGITIDLGFAHTSLGDKRIAVIDVPGHERFVRNMLAGVGGIDLALLVVACDESVMPQTREHLAILNLLGVEAGVVAATKCDLADLDTREVVALEIADLTRGTFLESAPVIAVSARTGEGLDELRAALGAAAERARARDREGAFRLHVDRAFSIHGFGSVVTGTVWSGRARVGDELEIQPAGLAVKVRGIESHGVAVDEVAAGARAALNLAGVDLGSVGRGAQLVPAGVFAASSILAVRLRLLADASTPLRDSARVHLHLGASEVLAKIRLVDGAAALAPGEEAWAELRTEAPLLAWPGDRFIVRSYSPVRTIGGGTVVDLPSRKHRRGGRETLERLDSLAVGDLQRRLELLVANAGRLGATRRSLAVRSGQMPSRIDAALAASRDVVPVPGVEPRWFAVSVWNDLRTLAIATLRAFHKTSPLKDGMSREELRNRLLPDDVPAGRRLLDDLSTSGAVRLTADLASLPGHRVSLSDDERQRSERIEGAFRAGGLTPPFAKEIVNCAADQSLVAVLVRAGRLVAAPGGLYFHREAIDSLKALLREQAAAGPMTVARFKELTGTSRKHAIPLLEYLDQSHFTRRQGDLRQVVG